MSEFHAAMGMCNLRHFEEVRSARRKVAEKYIDLLNEVDGIKLPVYEKHIDYNYAYFPVEVDEDLYGYTRDDIYDWLAMHRIFARKYFYPITSKFECYNKYSEVSLPVAEEISNRIICLPIYGDIEDEAIELICHVIKQKH